MAVIFSVPVYVPDVTSGETVVGYEVQSGTVNPASPSFVSSWVAVSGSPYASNRNIIDPAGLLTTYYRVRPVRQISIGATAVTLDTSWSRPFLSTDRLYDAVFTRLLLPTIRFTYLGDQGVTQTNSTLLEETTGAGNGVFQFDGFTKKFNLQYVMNDDPIKLLDEIYNLTYIPLGQVVPVPKVPYVDYIVNSRAGTLEFLVPPAPGDYVRFDFRRTDFVNADLLEMLTSGVNSLSSYGLNGYQVNTSYNLLSLSKPLDTPDIAEIISKVSVLRLREGQTEVAMRSTTAWRDGSSAVDPFPSRALQFLVEKTNLNDTHIRKEINTYLRLTTAPLHRGEYEVFFDSVQLSPFVGFINLGFSTGSAFQAAILPWYL